MSDIAPIAFIVDDDLAARLSLAPFIRREGWRLEIPAFARKFFDYLRVQIRNCHIADVPFVGTNRVVRILDRVLQ